MNAGFAFEDSKVSLCSESALFLLKIFMKHLLCSDPESESFHVGINTHTSLLGGPIQLPCGCYHL
jgi:hypothetical protein